MNRSTFHSCERHGWCDVTLVIGQFLRRGVGGIIPTTTNHIFPLLLGRVVDITVSCMGELVY
jgi:hypothetical protein